MLSPIPCSRFNSATHGSKRAAAKRMTPAKFRLPRSLSRTPKIQAHKPKISPSTVPDVQASQHYEVRHGQPKIINTGRWTKSERIAFLRGLRRYGKSKWKEISKTIPTRDTTQTKTHAQTVLKLLAGGQNIFAELDHYERHHVSDRETNSVENAFSPSEQQPEKKIVGSTTPGLTWKAKDFDGAKALIMLKGTKLF